MHGPPSGRRPVDETTHPQRPGEWFRSGRWLAGACGGAIVFPAVVLHELDTSGDSPRSDSPIRSCGSPLPAGPVSGRSADAYGPGQVCLAASGEPVNPDAKVEERPLVTPRWGDAPKIKDGRRFFAPACGPSSAGRAPLGVRNPYSDPVRPGLWAAWPEGERLRIPQIPALSASTPSYGSTC